MLLPENFECAFNIRHQMLDPQYQSTSRKRWGLDTSRAPFPMWLSMVYTVLLQNVLPQNVLVFKTSFLQNVLPQNIQSTKRPWIQNVLVYQTFRPQNVLPSKHPHLQNVLAFKTSFHKTSFPLSFHKTSFFNLTGSLLTFTITITAKTSKNCT
jgi:hypothetical protein